MDEDALARIKDRIEELGTSARAVSLEVTGNTNAHYLQKLFTGKASDITSRRLIKLAQVLDTTLEWILEGRGEKQRDNTVTGFYSFFERLPPEGRERVRDFAKFESQRKKNSNDK